MRKRKSNLSAGRSNKLGSYIRGKRVGHSLAVAAENLDVAKNTLLSYEQGKSLPDIDFLALFSDWYSVDLPTLIHLRLDASEIKTVRDLANQIPARDTSINTSSNGHEPWALNKKLLTQILSAAELSGVGQRGFVSPRLKAEYVVHVYNALYQAGNVDNDTLRGLMSTGRRITNSNSQ